jgi:hypothetical protein
MQKWEYMIISAKVGDGFTRSEATKMVNHLGGEGWELVTSTSDSTGNQVKLFFKRPISD